MKKLCLFLFPSVFLYYSCDKPFYCGEVQGIENSSPLIIYPFNTVANDFLYPEIESRSQYKRDSLQVLDDEGKEYPFLDFLLKSDPRNTINGFYAIKVSPGFRIPQDNDAYNAEKTKQIYLKYNYNTVDTLTLIFKAYKDNCDKGQYEYLKIYHRNQLIFTKPEGYPTEFTLNH